MMIMTHRTAPVLVATTLGHTYVFKPGVAISVHERAIDQCQMRGAVFVDAAEEAAQPTGMPPKPKAAPTTAQRHAAMRALFVDMVANPHKHRSHFTAGNRPNMRWVQKELGMEVAAMDIEQIWIEVKHAPTADKDKTARQTAETVRAAGAV
jgi:hypothetical protein